VDLFSSFNIGSVSRSSQESIIFRRFQQKNPYPGTCTTLNIYIDCISMRVFLVSLSSHTSQSFTVRKESTSGYRYRYHTRSSGLNFSDDVRKTTMDLTILRSGHTKK